MRWLLTIFFIVFLTLQYQLWIADSGMRETWRLQAAVARTTADNVTKVERNNALEAEVTDLKEGLVAVEERARTELGMIGPDETFYLITKPKATSALLQ